MLKVKIDQSEAGWEIGKNFLEESILVFFYFFGKALADIPVGDIVFDKVRNGDEWDIDERISDFGGN